MKKNNTTNPVIPDLDRESIQIDPRVREDGKKEISLLKEQVGALDDKFKRALADYQNLERNQHQSKFIEKGRIISKFLPLLDGLELTHQHTKDPVTEMVVKEFKKVLNELSVDLIKSDQGADFNSLTMECIEVVAGEKDKIVKTIQPGYKLGDIILRPAVVEVGDGSPTEIPSTSTILSMPEGPEGSFK